MRLNLYLLLIIFQISTISAQNIVVNGGFESGPYGWNEILTIDWHTGGGSCQEGTFFPASGSGLVGIRFYHQTNWEDDKNWQEYIYQNIEGKMIAGETYKVSFKYRLANRCTMTTDAMGIAFFENTNGTLSHQTIRYANAQVTNPVGNFLTYYHTYKTFTGYYTATGQEDFFGLGAFKMDHNMTRIPLNNNPTYPIDDILFFFDDVSISICNEYPVFDFPEQIVLCQTENYILDVNIPNADNYIWNTGDTTQSIGVGNQSEDYWVEVTKNGCTNRDSTKIKIFSGPFDLGPDQIVCSETDLSTTLTIPKNLEENIYWQDGSNESPRIITEPGTYLVTKSYGDCYFTDSISYKNFSDEIFIYPNPTSDVLKIDLEQDVLIEGLYSNDGKTLLFDNISLDELNALIPHVQSSTYFLLVNYKGCRELLQFSKIH